MLSEVLKEEQIKFDRKSLGNGFDGESLKRRIEYAQYLIVHTAEPLEKIASDGGWASIETFVAVFEIMVGVTPTHYRNWHRD
jgi:transcriptional regulator GlxA family with amidase domain